MSIREVLGEILGLLSLLAIEVNCQLQLVVSPVDVPAAAYYLDDISYSHGTEIIMSKGKWYIVLNQIQNTCMIFR